jgi:putative hydrolase of the HAD superfamily
MIRGVAFDLDHTLIDRDAGFRAFIEAECRGFPEHTLDRARVAELDRGGYGPKVPLLDYLARNLGWTEFDFASRHARFSAGVVAAVEPDPALEALLTRISTRYALAVISNGSSRMQRGKLEKLGIMHVFSPVLISEEVGAKKPDCTIFARLLEAWPIDAQSIVFVGDHPQLDVVGARDAGLRSLWLSNGRPWPLKDAPPPATIGQLSELEAALRALEETA